jgi:hypothetical protein
MAAEHELAAALWQQRCAFWRMLLGEALPDWKLLEELHASLCAGEARFRALQLDSRRSQLQDAWQSALLGEAPDWRALERIHREMAALERDSAPAPSDRNPL